MSQVVPRLIGLAGPAGVGKSTVARALCALSGVAGLPPFRRHRFAGPLKDMLIALGLTSEQVDGGEKETPCVLLADATPRQAMRSLGDWGRSHAVDFWVHPTMARVERDLQAGLGVVVDDVRFDNEARAISLLGGVIFKLSRRGVNASAEHSSEVGIHGDLVNYIVPNNETPEDAAREIAWLLVNRPHP